MRFSLKKGTNSEYCDAVLKNSGKFTKPFGRIASVIASLVLALLCVDAVAGSGERVAADSALAMFLLGLAVGVPSGIGLFFGYLMLREKRHAAEPDELDVFLESLENEEDPWTPPAKGGFGFDRDTAFREVSEEEPIESLDPWERPADWWRDSDD